ncbi:acriflavin resistance protein [Fulvitalea axinellae]|uniref:Acriflavin resistance protein n=1 Tax=Fulvitalea axinellae TaxID=1182444 RepID=A0AAU9DJ29_9BACT|nr:acriflavin resistance protein [Fulvitalea axinellae]
MKKIVSYFIKYPIAGNLMIVAVLWLGYLSMRQTRATLSPAVEPGFIKVQVVYPGASAEEVENGVVQKIENALKGTKGIDKVTSVSSENSAFITVEAESGYDINVLLQEVKNAVDGVNSYPSGMENPVVEKWTFSDKAVDFALSGNVDLATLKTYAQRAENELLNTKDVTDVELSGFPDEEIEIALREADLRRFGLTFNEVAQAVRRSNIDLTGGTIRGAEEDLMIRTRQKKFYGEELENIVIRGNTMGGIVTLKDVADINDEWVDSPNRFYVNGNPAIRIRVNFTDTEDVVEIARQVREFIAEYNEKHNDVKASVLLDRSEGISIMMDILLQNGVLGIGLVLLFLSLFLHPRLAFWVAFALPICFMGMFMIGAAYGITLNGVSLFGLIIVVGILVDDGIVICESIYQEYEKGKPRIRAAIDGTMKVLPGVFSAVLTTMVAFATFFFLDGILGKLFVELGVVVIATLLFSLLESFTTLPAHIANSKALKPVTKTRKESVGQRSLKKVRIAIYEPLLRWAMRHRFVTLCMPVGIMMITIGAMQGGIIRLGDTSADDLGAATVTLEMPPGTSETVTQKYLDLLEEKARETSVEFDARSKDNEAVKFITESIKGTNAGEVSAYLVNTDERDFTSEEFASAWRKKVGEIPEAEKVNFAKETRYGKPVFLNISGYNLEELTEAKEYLKAELKQLSDLKNVEDDDVLGTREVEITLKPKAYLLGITLEEVISQVRQGYFGEEAQRLTRGEDEVKIYVRYKKEERATVGQLENIHIRLSDGREVPLSEVANMRFTRSLVSINHLNGKRNIAVMADLASKQANLNDIKSEIDNRIIPEVEAKYPGISIIKGGRDERLKETYDSMLKVVPIIVFIILAIVVWTFRSVLQAGVIFLLVPLGMIGVGWGHFLHGYGVDLTSYLGMVALIGVMINDSIVLVEAMNHNIAHGMKLNDAVYEAAVSRFRPIILTTLTTVVGLMPAIFFSNTDSEFVVPMAISLSYGLIVATFLTLIVLPVLLLVGNSARRKIIWIWTGKNKSPEEVEPALRGIHIEEEAKESEEKGGEDK